MGNNNKDIAELGIHNSRQEKQSVSREQWLGWRGESWKEALEGRPGAGERERGASRGRRERKR